MKIQCPHCKSSCTNRKSNQVSPMYREITFTCDNLECGHVFVAAISPIRTISLSSMPDLSVHIPLSSRIRKDDLVKTMGTAYSGKS
ncbi:ogr/Delta-like zinc finger family protein [Alteromonas sp. a30]|uniref:ogr/Delta-like zinc finger family protein n=1 Tax=Alteromonas sp. a30 TaxID=2730917 RepID=UPI00227F3694|nr:ogr/Delta-like zinc finger family protein [Alteromonas sp. a30]MCY7297402.1 ogr/Delta-like zinc finger family protein [Alteromonas sp. a30]